MNIEEKKRKIIELLETASGRNIEIIYRFVYNLLT